MPYQTLLQRRCEEASIDWAAISAKGLGRICSTGTSRASRRKPSLHVPRMPRVSQRLVRASEIWSASNATST